MSGAQADENAPRCVGCGHCLDTDHSGGQHPGHYGWCPALLPGGGESDG